MAHKRGRTITRPIGEGLASIGIDPAAVEDVIVSHLHYDHCGNYDLFPRARYHLQDCEMAYATGRCMCHALIRFPFEVEDVVAMVRKVFSGRVVFHEGTEQMAPGITLHHIGGHSRGLQCVRVNTRRGRVVLASDATHLYAHINEGRVFPVTYSVAETLEGYTTIKKLADSIDHIVPGHDPQVLTRYPAAAPQLENWVVRLDVAPK
jgi:glyoxylase-like metal-dependent hydrolase (beta-lactamase superfamily II)